MAFCSDVAQENHESLAATASRVEHWLLVEYRGLWAPKHLSESALSDALKEHLATQMRALDYCRVVFIRRPDRRREKKLVCFYGRSGERDQRFFGLEIDGHEELLDVDFAGALANGPSLGEPLGHPLLLACTHGKRDRCCARYGRPLYEALSDQAEPSWVWQSTHLGGDRFAANLVCLPEGLYFGRVAPVDVWPLLDDYLAGRIHLDRFRGRSCYPFAVQAAEREVRAASGLTGIADLRLLEAGRKGGGWNVQFLAEPSGDVHDVTVEATLGDLTYLTCCASTLQRPRRFVATSRRIHPAG
jgi:hypothetical protein